LEALVASDSRFKHTTLVKLKDRHGFGWAVKTACVMAQTPYVLVVQHDYELVSAFDATGLIHLMDTQPDVKYVNLLSKSTCNYINLVDGKYNMKLTKRVFPSGQSLIPLLFWYDKPHVACRKHYLLLVFGCGLDGRYDFTNKMERNRKFIVGKGDFIEDTFGSFILGDLKEHGMSRHGDMYGTWILDACQIHTRHLHGRRFLSQDQKEQTGLRGRVRWGPLERIERGEETKMGTTSIPPSYSCSCRCICHLPVQPNSHPLLRPSIATTRTQEETPVVLHPLATELLSSHFHSNSSDS
jgi:hypothetical protein